MLKNYKAEEGRLAILALGLMLRNGTQIMGAGIGQAGWLSHRGWESLEAFFSLCDRDIVGSPGVRINY